MEIQRSKNCVLYGYPSPPIMEDIVNLILNHDEIYDYEDMLEPLKNQTARLAQHFSGVKLSPEECKGWDLSGIFIYIWSVCKYYGYNFLHDLTSEVEKKVVWLDKAKSSRQEDCERFIRILDYFYQILQKQNPSVAKKLSDNLLNVHKLFSERIIIPREILVTEIVEARNATDDILTRATDADMKDKSFLSLLKKYHENDDPWWISFSLNGMLLESSYLKIPLHSWDFDKPLIEYKLERGAQYIPKFKKEDVIKEAFSVLVPEVYVLDVPDLLKVRSTSEFASFRREVNEIYNQVLESPKDFKDEKSINDYLHNEYFLKLEKLANERRPKPGTVLLRNFISLVHPIVGILNSSEQVFEEYMDKYKDWKFALSTLEMKNRINDYIYKNKR